MSFFESLLALLLAAIVLLQVARRLALPYPAMLAAAGVVLALVPGTPSIELEPHTALALFIAPALVDAAFDFPLPAIRTLWRPLFALAVVAVLLTAGSVAAIGMSVAGLPFYAALALGAIVAPPDAAAATAVLRTVRMPRGSVTVLKGESLLNDALALLLFSVAVAIQERGGIDGSVGLRLALAAPGGVLLGIMLAWVNRWLSRFVSGTLGGQLLQFVGAFAVWILAERLGLSAVLCLVAFAMTIARRAGLTERPRMRVHSFAVWTSVVFLLNVLAFLLMGMQAKTIVGAMSAARLREAAEFAGLVVVCVIVVRLVWVFIYNRLANHFAALQSEGEPPSLKRGILVGWCGMRGLVTLATAFALPGDFPQRDLTLLTAFGVVLATLVVQGLTLAPLVRLLGLDGDDGHDAELAAARVSLAQAGLELLDGKTGMHADYLRHAYRSVLDRSGSDTGDLATSKRQLGLDAIARQRQRLEELRADQSVGADSYLVLQEELDFRELALTTEEEREIEES